MLRGVKEQVPN